MILILTKIEFLINILDLVSNICTKFHEILTKNTKIIRNMPKNTIFEVKSKGFFVHNI